MNHVDFKAGANSYRLGTATNERPNQLTLTNPDEFQGFAQRESVIANNLPKINWLQFGELFIWGISDEDITTIRKFLEC